MINTIRIFSYSRKGLARTPNIDWIAQGTSFIEMDKGYPSNYEGIAQYFKLTQKILVNIKNKRGIINETI